MSMVVTSNPATTASLIHAVIRNSTCVNDWRRIAFDATDGVTRLPATQRAAVATAQCVPAAADAAAALTESLHDIATYATTVQGRGGETALSDYP
jgi:hypothetical protein